MRLDRFALPALLLAASSALAQGTAPAPAAVPTGTPEQLADVLTKWEKAMAAVDTLAAQMKRTEVNNTWKRTEVYTGVAQYMKVAGGDKVQNLAILHMANQARPEQQWERFLCTGELLYRYLPSAKKIEVHQVPAPKPGQVGDSSFLTFLFGMKAEDAQKRYDLTLQYPNDPNWIIIHVRPRQVQDKQDFQQARFVLDRKTLMPKQLWFEQPTGDLVTWDLEKVQTGVKLDRTTFLAPEKPAGWEMVRVPAKGAEATPPRKAIP